MSHRPPSVRIEPTIDRWSPGTGGHDLNDLIARINDRATRLDTAQLDSQPKQLITTGHQAQLWHPGILAKDIAMDIAAQRFGTRRLHLIVDQDINEAWRLDVPYVQDERLRVRSLLLADQLPGVPTGYQAPADITEVQRRLAGVDSPLTASLLRAFKKLPPCESLAEQVAAVLARLKKPFAGDIPIMLVSDLVGWPAYEAIVMRMLKEANDCVSAYNKAVSQHPEAGMSPLIVSRDFVELPLWAVAWEQPRRRVFADLTDSQPVFVFDDGEPIDRDQFALLPRALLLTAVMRACLCDLFIHGTGGLVYDRITEQWWGDWAGDTLAPMAGATANVYLNLDAPIADQADLTRAVWQKHHLPHNLDRALNLTGHLVERKRELLAHMDDDRDKARRRDAFRELKQINRELAEQHPDQLQAADRALARARAGVGNTNIAGRRDWCFALYPEEDLHDLRRMIETGRAVPGEVQSPS